MLFGSGLPEHGLEPLSATQHASYAIIYANDLHNALPAKGAQLGRHLYHGCWGRDLTLSAFQFHKFGSRVYVHVLGQLFTHRNKDAPKGIPAQFLGFARPTGSGIYRVKLDSGREVQSQTVVFDGAPLPPILRPDHAEQHNEAAMLKADSDSESDTDVPRALGEQHEGG
jgi:hypothetical protein